MGLILPNRPSDQPYARVRVGMAVLVEHTGYGATDSTGAELPLVGLVNGVYPDGELTTDLDGVARPWPGPSPLVDVVCVLANGEMLAIQKIGRARDVARQAELSGLPATAAGLLAGYRLIHTLKGE